jgi:hypothetical protein
LFAQKSAAGLEHTVAIDWQMVGAGAVGEEITPLIVISLKFMNVKSNTRKNFRILCLRVIWMAFAMLAAKLMNGWYGLATLRQLL